MTKSFLLSYILISTIIPDVTITVGSDNSVSVRFTADEESSQIPTERNCNQIRCRRLVSLRNEAKLERFLAEVYEPKVNQIAHEQTLAEWNHLTDITDSVKEQTLVNTTVALAKFEKQFWEKYFSHIRPEHFRDESLRRQISKLKMLENAALNDQDLSKLTRLLNNMTTIYSTARICPYEKQKCNLTSEGLQLDPHLENIMANSSNYDKLKYIWIAWRDATGMKMEEQYMDYVELSNKAARKNGFVNKAAMWQADFEVKSLYDFVRRLWSSLEPFYDDLHKYVHKKLKQRYPMIANDTDGLIPAHLLGNMWAQSWSSLSELVRPYPNASRVDVTSALLEQNFTVSKMFQVADEFYTSLGLMSASMSFGAKAMIVKPKDKEVLCHASAWDFGKGCDFRIKMCTQVNFDDFVTIHHEMGHIQYFIQYNHLPYSFRNGANPGFHEAIGDTIALSVTTPVHLKKIGILKEHTDNEETTINALMDMALERIAFMPYSLIVDLWRWDVFRGKADRKSWNALWWQYREKFQKVKAPVERTNDDFDPGSKYHVVSDSQYISYFFAHILEFQLHRSLCIAASRYKHGRLHQCDIYQSKLAGDRLRSGLAVGSSEHWTSVLWKITREKRLSTSPMLEYFQPLRKWLQTENYLIPYKDRYLKYYKYREP